ncbi:MAG: amidohydrolase [Bacteroidia bacterium]|nr:amidohydrolase [Bacteroidia bacterium]
MLKNAFILILAMIIFVCCSREKEKADLIIHNAAIYTVDSSFSKKEALAVKDGRIIDIGSNDEILNRYQSAETNDAQGKSIFPGLIDAHCHFTGYATDMWKCDLTGTTSFEEVIEKIRVYEKTAPMYWIYGRGWDQNDWSVKEFPTKEQLDLLFPDRPVFLKRVDGHAALVNQKALDLTGITATTSVKGGSLELKNGKLTGILIDNAMDLVDLKIPSVSDSLAKHYFGIAQQTCFSLGLTSIHDCGISEHTVDLLKEVEKNGKLKMKVFALLSDDPSYYDRWIKNGIYKGSRFTVGGFKIYGDGALGSRGACLHQPYSDKPSWTGFMLTDTHRIKTIAEILIQSPFQYCTHAIGDSANSYMLRAYAKALKGKNNKRWRIEHAQVLDSSLFHFFGDFNIIPSVQPTHATSDMYWAGDRVGTKRLKFAYAYKRLLEQNGFIALGTDFPVESISPIKTFYAAVERKDAKGFPENGFQKENALSREEALRGMTIWASYAAFEETEKGSLEKGKAADFIIVDTDLMTCKPEDILKTKVIATYSNGEKVFGNTQP